MALNRKPASSIAISLRTILTTPYTILIVLSISVVGYIFFQNGEASVNNVAIQLRNEAALRVKQYLSTFLEIPHQINQFNAYAIQSGELTLTDTAEMQRHFLEQVKLHPSITSVYFGNTKGGLVGGGREGAKGSLYVTSTGNNQSGEFLKFGVDETGKIAREPLISVPDFDGRARPWYMSAAKKGDTAWSDIYVLFTGQDMAIATSQPVYDEQNNLLGVVSIDIFLSQLSDYLKTSSISPMGRVFIMERSGALVATSSGETLFEDKNGDGTKDRIFAHDSRSAIIRQTDNLLVKTYGDYKHIPGEEQQLEFDLNGERQFLQLLSVRDPYGIDWIVVVTLPESAFTKQIHESNQIAFWLTICTLAVSITTSVFISLKITKRISQLDKSAQALAAGEWDTELDADTRIAELNELAVSFNQMKDQLRHTLDSLKVEVAERKRMEQELQSQRDFATQVINMMGQGLTVTDSNGRFEFVNPAYARLFGYKPADLIGKGPKDVTVLDDYTTLESQIKQRREGNTTSYESRLHRADGSIAHVLITGVPRESEGRYEGSIAVITDLTEQKRIEDELRQAKNLLELSNGKLEQSLLREQELSRTDDLTGVNNRRHLFELAEREFAIASRYERPLAVTLFDIDHFKKVNDTFGHAIGDQVLKHIAKVVCSELRRTDVIGRYGGEEFIILSPMTHARRAYLLAERIRKKAETLRMEIADHDIVVTLSTGIVEMNKNSNYKTVEDVFQRADQAMYSAKQAGRNCTVILDG